MNPLRRLTFPVPPGLLAVSGVMVLVTAAWTSREVTNGLAVVWVTVSSNVKESLFAAGPTAGFAALMVAIRFNTPKSIILPVSAVRAGSRSVSRHLTVITAVAALSLMLGQIPAIVAASSRATYGGPDLLVAVSAIPVLAAYVSVGYLVGTMFPNWRGAVVGGLSLIGMSLVGGMTGSQWWSVAPVWTYGLTRAGFHDSLPLTLFRVFFFTFVTAIAGCTSSALVSRRNGPSHRRVALIARNLTPLLLLALVAGVRPPAIQHRELSPPTICEVVSHASVCVHAAHSDLLPALAAISEQAFNIAGPHLARGLHEIGDDSVLPDNGTHEASIVLDLSSERELRDLAAVQLARWLARVEACKPNPDGTIGDAQQINEGIQLWIYRQLATDSSDAGYFVSEGITPYVADRLTQMTPSEVEQWTGRSFDAITRCTVMAADVP